MSLPVPPSVSPPIIDEWSAHLWHISQHNRMVIGLGGRLQNLANEMRQSVGLPEFGWDTAFPDARFGECSVHVEGCAGQEAHQGWTAVPIMRLAVLDAARERHPIWVTLRSGVVLSGTPAAHMSRDESIHLHTDEGWHTVDYAEVAAISTTRPASP